MTTVVQAPPLRQGGLDLRFGQVLGAHQPDHRRNEVREGRTPLRDGDRDRAEPPVPPWSLIPPGSDQACEREQCEGHRRHVSPELEAGIGPRLRRSVLPLGNDDPGLVNPCAEGGAEVYDKQPQQDPREVLSHFIYLPCSTPLSLGAMMPGAEVQRLRPEAIHPSAWKGSSTKF